MSSLVGQIASRLRAGVRRRERVVPVVPWVVRKRWERSAADDPAAALHLLYLRHRRDYLPAYFAKFHAYPAPRNWLSRAWRWYFSDVLVQSVRLLRSTGRQVRTEAGVPLPRQLRELLWFSVSLPSMPENYYKYELYRSANRARAGEYLHRHETKGALYEMLGALADISDLDYAAPLNDKAAFARHAANAGLSVVPTLAVIDGQASGSPDELPAVDLFIKPVSGKGGRGIQSWSYSAADDQFQRAGGSPATVARSDLVVWLTGQLVGRSLLVQPRLTGYPELTDLALDAIPTCRVVTILDEAGEPEPVIAIFRMPAVRGALVDNLHRGGIAAPVDIATGTLGAASGYAVGSSAGRHSTHPVTGGRIEGRKLPLWSDVVALVRQAHFAFRPRVLVGWDVSIGDSGPLLIEGNEQPGVDGLQRLHNQPLGSHRFGRLLAFHLRRAWQL